ncbi:hypothetical protein VSS37_10425 [Candidatus Thiothrix sp. Deng01]|uniref:Phage portal protein n=1 Tax=Candidatus Thiothrix phosphatis TaxID=3112415 RepID=A0ABU6CZ80_9GAMM|nr:hypothetical protein [Candidatus Thiothrix sp. Deng01]MEB4591394.1 hypothetical protein [Candidatus Thiothrix sp. Deng01]
MSKTTTYAPPATEASSAVVANRWGDPESALEASRLELVYGSQLAHNGQYYEPPIPFEGLARLRRVNPHHSPLPEFVANWVVRYMKPHPLIQRQELRRMLIDYETTGNGFLRRHTDQAGRTVRISHQPTINTRRAADPARYGYLKPDTREFQLFYGVEILHHAQHETLQQMYGTPYWIGAMQSILLGEDVRIFPRLFFKNGGSTGDMVVTSGLTGKEQENVEGIVGKVKGGGRFLRMVFQFSRGKIDEMVKVIPYSTGSDKIDFSKLANLSSDDVLDAWGIRAELVGMTPDTPGGSGDLDKLKRMWHEGGVIPRQQALQDLLEGVLPVPLAFYGYDELDTAYSG